MCMITPYLFRPLEITYESPDCQYGIVALGISVELMQGPITPNAGEADG